MPRFLGGGGTGRRRVGGPFVPRTRHRAALRLTSKDGAVTYEQPTTIKDIAALVQGTSRAAQVVLIEEVSYQDAGKERFRVRDTLAEMEKDRLYGMKPSHYLSQMDNVNAARDEALKHPVGQRLYVDTADDGFLEIGRIKRGLRTSRLRLSYYDAKIGVQRFDPTLPGSTEQSAQYMSQMQSLVEADQAERAARLDAALEGTVEDEVLADDQEERRRRSEELEAALRDTARRFGAPVATS